MGCGQISSVKYVEVRLITYLHNRLIASIFRNMVVIHGRRGAINRVSTNRWMNIEIS